ncbi:MAG: DUF2085 domain-containing protein [Anaerolineales bacterium]|nr:DUF2085 domain-containing protein [Anaerolineales bacterium]
MTLHLVLYLRMEDPACAAAQEWSDSLQKEYPHTLEIREVDSRPEWKRAFGGEVPAAEVNGRRLAAPLTFPELKSALAVGRAIGEYQRETRVPRPVRALSSAADGCAGWFSRHWLAVFNVFLGAYLGVAFLAPVLMKVGAVTPASWIYNVYRFSCHQLGFRSFYLFGEQPYYLRADFEEVTGINPDDLWASRDFVGNARLGYKVALCQRDVAIYSALLLAGIAFHFLRGKVKPLHWSLWILLGIFPIGLDGGTQLLSYIPILHFPFRESTPLLRVVTGAMFGLTSAWFAYPYVQESVDEDLPAKPAPRA